jgi:chemotaxis protein histidine kinase CheA
MANLKSSPSYEEMIAQAEAAVAALRDTYREQLAADVVTLGEIWSRLDPENPDPVLQEVQSLAHNIKGQGGSFGYDLVTSIGAFLCDYMRKSRRASPKELEIILAHIKLLKLVSDNDISGVGGETGERIVERLRALTA